MRHGKASFAAMVAPLLGGLFAHGCAATPPPNRREPPPAGPRVVDFAAGVRLDYRVPQVEIDARVILREGPIELLLYSKAPVPKEHESILLTDAPAESVYYALGLIGLRPGRPPRYDDATGRVLPATGDEVEVRVRYARDGRMFEHPAADWLLDIAASHPPTDLRWVFAGSGRDAGGRYLANLEGTTITVVDFESAVVAPAASHSSANESLWLQAQREAIPPVGTAVTVLLRPACGPAASRQ